jgi:hypothetical protein
VQVIAAHDLDELRAELKKAEAQIRDQGTERHTDVAGTNDSAGNAGPLIAVTIASDSGDPA